MKVKVLLDSGSKVNVMTLAFAIKLKFKSRPTNIGMQKIDGLILEIYSIVSTEFSL